MAILNIAITSIVVAATTISLWLLQTAIFSPLKSIPGPWYTRISKLPLKLVTLAGQRIFFIDSLHRRYGPIVRVAPGEVAVADLSAFKQIHSLGSGYLKTVWYSKLLGLHREAAFSIIDHKAHAQRRKNFARQYTKSHLRENNETFIKSHVELTVRKIKSDAQKGDANLLKWWMLMTADIAGRLVFGEPLGSVEAGEISEFIAAMEAYTMIGGLNAELPFLKPMLKHVPYLRNFMERDKLVARAEKAVELAKASAGESSVFSTPIKEKTMDEEDIKVEMIGHMVGGTDTTAITMCYLVWAVLQRPKLQQELEDEVLKLPAAFTEQDLENLPLLTGVIEESLRLYGAAPGTLPREVPTGGRQLGGYFIPEGITVGTQSYSFHRDPKLFPDPLRFEPRRWLPDSNMSADAKIAFHPFGAGSRNCVGSALARMEMRYATATFFRVCKGARLSASTTPESMEMLNFFLIIPKSQRCNISLR